MNIQLIVFDLGRVLLRICDSWQQACEIAGIAVPGNLELDDARKQRAAELVIRYDSGKMSVEEFAREIAPLRGLRPQDVLAIVDCFLRETYPGAVELLQDIRAAGVRTACLSNTSDPHWKQMLDPTHRAHLPMHLLDYAFASHLIGCCKPAAEIYQHVERESRLRGEQIIFFDDLLENVEGARARGWHAYKIEVGPDPIAQARSHLAAHGVLR
jgi:putative hydrolase of the HAD superfamily